MFTEISYKKGVNYYFNKCFLCTTNLQHRVFLAKFSFILRVLRGYNCFGCGSAALCTPWLTAKSGFNGIYKN